MKTDKAKRHHIIMGYSKPRLQAEIFLLDGTILSLEKELKANQWQPIDCPEDITDFNEPVLMWDGCECHIDYTESDAETGAVFIANGRECTHWMPLPQPPTH